MNREEIEAALGKKMHEIGKQQAICVRENERLKVLNDEANKLDVELTKLDGQ